MPPPGTWRDVVRDAQAYREASLAALEPALPSIPDPLPSKVTGLPAQILTPSELEMTSQAPETLVSLIASGQYNTKQVTRAYLRRAALAQRLVNCVTELLPTRALNRARELDEYLAEHHKPVGPLHGLPISVKEHIDMEGLGFNGGFCSEWNTPPRKVDAHILRILWRAGCVFYCRTTEPQTTMHLETASNLYGVTRNPNNVSLTAGGSSGGEGALIGMGGSCLGIGSDIGGSIRVPASHNACYGLRPTSLRLPYSDISPALSGMEHVTTVIGPLSPTIGGIKLLMQVVLDAQPWLIEPSLMPCHWRAEGKLITNPKLKIAVMHTDGIVTPHPPVTRVLGSAVAKLSSPAAAECIDLVDWSPYKHDEAWRLIASLYFPDGGSFEHRAAAATGEPFLPLSRWVIDENPYCRALTIEELWKLNDHRERYRSEYARRWTDTATGTDSKGRPTGMVDVILCPASPGAANIFNTSKYWGYTSQWNLLDYPAVVFPAGKVVQSSDKKIEGYVAMNEADKYNYELYTGPERYLDSPIGLQLVGRPHEDEKVMQSLEIIEQFLR